MKIISVVGARPNFMKVAPLHKAFKKYSKTITHLICHTGQHYDENMSKVFFNDLELPNPDYYLGVGGGSHAQQTAKIMIEFEKILLKEEPDFIIVVGDVNSTVACSLTASKLGIKIAHVEAGLRSFDRTMPEEINRVLTDVISDYLFVTEESGLTNLKSEGIHDKKVFFVGNCMIDSLCSYLEKSCRTKIMNDMNVENQNYVLVTLHRPNNVDMAESLCEVLSMLNNLSKEKKIIFPVHPRTRNNIKLFGLENYLSKNIIVCDPIGYLDFISLIANAQLIITDSGGIQEETTYLGIQCLTLRNNTERPVTCTIGTNTLIGTDFKKAEEAAFRILHGEIKSGSIPPLWDGKAAERIVTILLNSI
jgi:UDP-N-acetylglucosamine 2-epimerase (non-hydrolysing)